MVVLRRRRRGGSVGGGAEATVGGGISSSSSSAAMPSAIHPGIVCGVAPLVSARFLLVVLPALVQDFSVLRYLLGDGFNVVKLLDKVVGIPELPVQVGLSSRLLLLLLLLLRQPPRG